MKMILGGSSLPFRCSSDWADEIYAQVLTHCLRDENPRPASQLLRYNPQQRRASRSGEKLYYSSKF